MVGVFIKYDYYSERSILSKCRVRSTEYTYGISLIKMFS
jgi:hypothetical protein